MIEVLVISENNTAAEMLKTVHKVLGAKFVKHMHSLVIKSNYSKAKVCGLVNAKIKTLHGKRDGVLIMTEVFGSTQTNLCLDLLNRNDVRLISGYNLPMLLKAATLNQVTTLQKLTPEITLAGKKYIRVYDKKRCA